MPRLSVPNLRPLLLALLASTAFALPATAQMPTTPTPPPAIAPASSGLAPVNNLALYYEIYGAGPPLVLLHGAYMNINLAWSAYIPALAEHHQVIAVELQGHGRTADLAGRPITYEQLADDVSALLTHLQIPEADIIGYSLGGNTALQMAIRHPDQTGHVVAISAAFAAGGWYPEVSAGIAALTPEMFAGTPLDIDYRALAPNPADWPLLMEKLKTLDLAPQDWRAAVDAIADPVFVIIGDSDGVSLEHAVETFRLVGGGVAGDYHGVPASRLAIIPGATHVGVLMRPDLLLPMIVPFLDDVPPPGVF